MSATTVLVATTGKRGRYRRRNLSELRPARPSRVFELGRTVGGRTSAEWRQSLAQVADERARQQTYPIDFWHARASRQEEEHIPELDPRDAIGTPALRARRVGREERDEVLERRGGESDV